MSAVVKNKFGLGPKKVLVLHGWFGASVYDNFFDSFNADEFEFALVDNPGYGAAKSQSPAKDMTDLANILLATADGLGWSKFHVIGHSYGGAAGLRMATISADRILSLTAIAPVMPSGFDETAAKNCNADANTGPAFMAAYAKGPRAADGPRMIAAALDPVLANDDQALQSLIDSTYDAINEETYKQYFLVWTGTSFVDEVKGLNTKSLFLIGKNDPFAAVNYVTPTANSMAPGAVQIKEIDGGHFLTVTGRYCSIEAIKSFLI